MLEFRGPRGVASCGRQRRRRQAPAPPCTDCDCGGPAGVPSTMG